MSYESYAIILFLLILGAIIIQHRKKMEVQKILFPLIYALIWRTKLGLRFMDTFAKKANKILRILGYVSITLGFLGMIFIMFSLVQNFISILFKPEALPGVGLVLPIKAKGVFYVPFFYWIISIFILAVVHEFSHGIYARLCNMDVKSSGFAVFSLLVPIIPAAFVEPDEKQMVKKSCKEQLMVYSAGPFANIVLAFIVLLLSFLIFAPIADVMIEANGVEISQVEEGYPAQIAGIQDGEIITALDGINTDYADNFSKILSGKSPGDVVEVKTIENSYNVTLAANPNNESRAYMGVYVGQSIEIKQDFKDKYGSYTPAIVLWIFGLMSWLYILNLGIGLFNLVPLGPLDGGRMLLVVLQKYFKDDKAKKIWLWISLLFLLLIIANIVVPYF